MGHINDQRAFHVRRSVSLGPIELRPLKRVRFGQRMKPRSWLSTTYWFKSALFARGRQSRRAKFAKLMGRPA